jgi:hypothetical protein
LIYIKDLRKKRALKRIEEDPIFGDDKIEDHNNIENLLLINYALKTFKLVIILTGCSYFTGIIWYIFCDLTSLLMQGNVDPYDPIHPGNFFIGYELEEQSKDRITIILTYFSFTTLSTIGLGDYHPKSDYERIFCAIIMMTGVIVFSTIMSIFLGIIEQI